MTRENWKFDRQPGASEIIGRKEVFVEASVSAVCNRCGFKKTLKKKEKVGYSLFSDGSNAKKFVMTSGRNMIIGTLKNELAILHINQHECHQRLIYK
jgi:hypothetical protein